MTASQAGELLHLQVKRIQALARQGRLPAVRSGRKWLFRRSDLQRALHANVMAARTAPSPGAGIDISARNQLAGRVVGLAFGDMMAEAQIQIGDQSLTAIITRSSAERLALREGDAVFAVVKSTEVMVAKAAGGRDSW